MAILASSSYSITNVNDGVGIANKTDFYLASNQSTGVVKPAELFNLIRNGGYPTNTQYWSGQVIVSQHNFYYNGQKNLFLLQTSGNSEITTSTNRFNVKRNTNYTLSFYAFAGSNVKNSDVYFLGRKSNETDAFTSAKAIIYERRFSASGTEYVTVTFNSGNNDNGYIRFDNNGSLDGVNALLFFGEVMLVEGDKPQNWVASIEDSGWTTTPQQISYTKRFLWNYRIELYTDGTIKATDPAVIGVYGDKGDTGAQGPQGIQGLQGPKGDQGIQGPTGADGKTQYTHIAYADNATGGGFSQTDQNKAYIGMYVDFIATDSTDPTKYKWSKWKGSDGAQGIPGPAGADGKTPYIHFAYSDNADGTGLTVTDNGQRYQGYYSDYTQDDSTDKTKYKWVDRWAKIDSGGRNYFKNSRSRTYTITSATTQDYRTFIYDEFWKNNKRFIKSMVRMSFDIEFSPALPNDIPVTIYFGASPWYSSGVTFKGGTAERQHFDLTFDLSSSSASYRTDNVFIRFTNNFPLNTNVSIRNANLYISSAKEDYRPALEDTQEQIDSKADQTLTQDQLNALAEKNNLIKAEMEAKASIDTVNQWITAYQNYVKANDADKAKSEQALKDASERILGIRYEVGNLKFVWDAIDTYMSFQNEGLVIGKKDGSAYAKFSDDRISLFSGSSEVMYISQGTLNIANGIFTKTIQIGRFRFETHPADADMLVVRFVGG